MSGEGVFHVATSRVRRARTGPGYVLACTCGQITTARTAKGAQRGHSFHVAQRISEDLR